MVVKDLKTLKYNELRKLAKSVGIRANQKIDKLIQALEAHYMENSTDVEQHEQLGQASPLTSTDAKTVDKRTSTTAVISNKKVPTPSNPTSVVNRKTPTAVVTGKKTPLSGNPSSNKRFISVANRKTPTATITSKKTPSSTNTASNKRFTSVVNRKTPSLTSAPAKSTPTSTNVTVAKKTVEKRKTPNALDPNSKRPLKRRRTFELEEASLGTMSTPTSDLSNARRSTRSSSRSNTPVEADNVPAGKRQRRGTYDKTDTKTEGEDTASPGTSAMIAAMDHTLSSAERKNNLLLAIQKKVEKRVAEKGAQSSQIPSLIPRLQATLGITKKEASSKSATPGKDWKKIHNKEFSRFDSIDVYLEKKQHRKDLLTGSGKKINPRLSAKNTKIAKPVVKPQASSVKPFVPTITSTKNLNFNFLKSPAAPSTANKTPKLKTPLFAGASAKSAASTNRATPFKFTGGGASLNTTVSSASKKNVFDLKASLAKPLSWRPHTGKLQPLDTNVSKTSAPTPSSAAFVPRGKMLLSRRPAHQALASKSRPTSRPTNPKDVRRVQQVQQADRRNNQKYIDMMRRRGLMA